MPVWDYCPVVEFGLVERPCIWLTGMALPTSKAWLIYERFIADFFG